ncbi:C40 family peptidase [Streptomyces sp. MUSC 125]|uniref:C40 family peptidase n=1 Tax=Streptomyces sp. MUSC 125 TaxID=1428624 RepID=UPI001F2D9C58|nr:NlpC/P60 family protein [Streptomyces sp. MUSC 125]
MTAPPAPPAPLTAPLPAVPRPGAAPPGRPGPAVVKAGNRSKLTAARDLLAQYAVQYAPRPTPPGPDAGFTAAQTSWGTGAWQEVGPAAAPAGQVPDSASFAQPADSSPTTGPLPRSGAPSVTSVATTAAPALYTGSAPDTGSAPAPDPGSLTGLPAPLSVPPRVARAAKAVAFARAQIGKPCVWGATGPDSYDCSSLIQAAWKAAGVVLPRAAQQQALAGAPVAPGDMEPGDLVLFFDDDRHVGLHVGDGVMVHAPGPGASIREESLHSAGEAAIHRIVRPA